ncbi:MAG: hypothetical protein ACJ76H_13390 [Bacteriovoracaceae bacterium]
MMKKLSLLFFLMIFTACSTIRMQVKAPYKSSQGNGHVTYERSYPVGGGMPLWCGLTAIFYGGACWAYLGMPFVPMEERAVKDATTVVNTKLGTTDAFLDGPVVKRLSCGSADTYVSYDEPKTDPINPPAQ